MSKENETLQMENQYLQIRVGKKQKKRRSNQKTQTIN